MNYFILVDQVFFLQRAATIAMDWRVMWLVHVLVTMWPTINAMEFLVSFCGSEGIARNFTGSLRRCNL